MIKVSVMTQQPGVGGVIPVEFSRFPCGERKLTIDTLKVSPNMYYEQISISLDYRSDSDLIDLMLLVDAIKRCPWLNYRYLVLLVGYFPYGRQDRVCNEGEPHSLKVICQMINSCGFDKVFVSDPHSDVLEALLDNLQIISVSDIAQMSSADCFTKYDAYVSPDAGAYKKVSKLSQVFNKDVVRADKIRDTKTGALSGFEVYSEDLTGRSVIIVDDLCDGGGTFLGVAEKLRQRGAEKVSLYVTHGMFTKGVAMMKEKLDEIYCFNYYGPEDERYLVNQVEVKQ